VASLSDLEKLERFPSDSVVGKFIRAVARRNFRKKHYGQIAPIEDIEQVLGISNSISRFACICRYNSRGKEMRYCFGLTAPFLEAVREYPDFADTHEELSKEEALELMKSFEHDGMTHSIWTFGTPYIGAICNCDQDCMVYKIFRYADLRTYFKGEYVASIDMDLCNGCRTCMRQCQYGAISFSVPLKRCFVDISKCYGCGVCRATCSKEAIGLMDRNEIPAVRNVW
jgi:ferredoxin